MNASPDPAARDPFQAAVVTAMQSDLDPQTVAEAVDRVLRDLYDGYDHLLLDVIEDGTVRRIGSVGPLEQELPVGQSFRSGEDPFRALDRHAIAVGDTATSPMRHAQRLARGGVGSFVVVPLRDAGELVAVLVLCHREPRAVGDEVLAAINGSLEHLGGAVRNMRTHQRERAALARLQAVDRLRDDLLALVSHDLRNPLGVIAGWAETLDLHWDTFTEERKRDLVVRIMGRANGLAEMVQQLLDVTRLESGDLRAESRPVELGALVSTVVEDQRQRPAGPTFATTLPDAPVRVLADEAMLRQVLANLLSNATRFSPQGGVVTVTVADHGDAVVISVTDQGRGVAPEDLDRIFGRYVRIGDEDVTVAAKGTGLGLYLCRMMVQAQGGTIRADSEVGCGTTITVTLPRAARPSLPA